MKVGDLVQHCLSEKTGLVLEVRTFPSMTYWDNGRGHFREERAKIRVYYSQSPQLSKHFSNTKFFEVINEAE